MASEATVPLSRAKLVASYEHAQAWAQHGYTEPSRSYWAGMRDTLAVLLGFTTEMPSVSVNDAAAMTLLSGS